MPSRVPSLFYRHLDGQVFLAGVAGHLEVLGSVLGPLNRGPEHLGRCGHRDVLPPDLAFRAKGPADVAGAHPDVLEGDVEETGQVQLHGVGALGGDVDFQPPIR